MSKIIGIDLGTTNSVVALMEGGEPKVILNEEGGRTTPSVVAFTRDGERLVGQVAKRQAITNPERTVYSIKRFIGRRFDEAESDRKRVPYPIVKGKSGDVRIEIGKDSLTPAEISAQILSKLKRAAENYLGEPVTEAVITVPAYFNDAQRQATKDAGRIAGLDVKRIVNEPTAAALAYGLDKEKEEKIAVYDFGGGTFDISILEVGEKVVEVLATAGDTRLGGDDVDEVLIEWLVAGFKKDTGIDISGDKMVLQRLKEAAEKAKVELSSTLESELNLPFLTADASGPKHLQMKLTRAKLEALIEPIVKRTLEPLEKALEDAGLKTGDIDEIILVGGSSRIPCVQAAVEAFFGKKAHRGVNPDEVVALGAAVQAGVLAGDVKDVLLLDVTPLSLGIETNGGVTTVLISRNTTIPTRKSQVFSTAADNQTQVEVHVLQGERSMAADNRTLGRVQLTGIALAPRGLPQIEVTFDLDADGILEVSAVDKATGASQNVTIQGGSGLSKTEIDAMVEEAKLHGAEDEERRSLIELKNRADALLHATGQLVQEQGEKLGPELISELESAAGGVKSALSTGEKGAIEAALDTLEGASHKAAEKLYAAQAENGHPANEDSDQDGDGDDVIDAEFEAA